MKLVTQYFITTAPVVILYIDYVVLMRYGGEATITGVTREWYQKSNWPEFIYVTFVVLLYCHLFRRWF